ncbi:MAG: single-stranded-DNA-specific exonuclease RecJ, partial [Chloroflexota bacterium]|nr:single-stranded-DNA-specific exonuclease RecJ [Chloroflexota bacterium]
MSQSWILRPPAHPTPELAATVGGHPLIAQLLAQRGFDTPAKARAFLDPTFYSPAPPTAFFGMAEAANLVCKAIAERQNILVWGDFDV